MFYYCDGMDFFPRASLVQMHMLINLFLIMMINNSFETNIFIMKIITLLFIDKKNHLLVLMDF
jgi:hypothetical protein